MKQTIQQLEEKIRSLEKELQDERHIKKAEDYLQHSLDAANDVIIILQDGKLQYTNPRIKGLLGYDPETVLGKDFIEYIPEENRYHLMDMYQRRIKGEPVATKYETTLIHKNGEKRQVEVSANMINYKGKPADMVIVHDITELKESLKTIRQSEEKYRSFFKTSRDCVFYTSKDGRWLDMSDSAPEFFGYESKEELLKVPIMNLYKYPETRTNDLRKIEEKGFTKDVPIMLVKKDGTIIDALVTSLAIRDQNGEITAYHGIIRDITDEKKAQKALKESKEHLEELNASKDKFFSVISHDLRTPFNAIIGFSELLWKNVHEFTTAEIKKIAEDLYRTGKETFELLTNLLEWSRSQRGKIEYKPSRLILKDLVHHALKIHEEYAKKKDIMISVTIPDAMAVFADENMVMTILRNLVSNAIKFTRPGGSVRIRSEKKNKTIHISVIDNGIGIDSEHLDHIFSLNKTIASSGTSGEPGSGLGLLLCKEFVEKNKGRIWVESTAGAGTTFVFTLPTPSS